MFESAFGFSANPFLLNPDPSFFFESKGHSSAFAHLKFGVYQGEGFIVITGEIGAGKTTLVRALLEQVDPGQVVAAQLVSTQLEADDLLRAVAVAFGVPVQGLSKSALLAALEAFLTALVPQNKRALLIVDEAQNLSAAAIEELRMLSNFQIGIRPLLQSFLIGQPELRDLLRGSSMQQLRQRIVSSYHLGPLSEEETCRYIDHRLRHVGWRGDPQIDEAVHAGVHRASGGIPRRINAICNRLLLAAFLEGRHQIGVDLLDGVLAEMREELGGLLPVAAPESDAEAWERGRDGDEAARIAVVRPFAYASIVARLDRLEKSIAAILELLRADPGAAGTRRGRSSTGRSRDRLG